MLFWNGTETILFIYFFNNFFLFFYVVVQTELDVDKTPKFGMVDEQYLEKVGFIVDDINNNMFFNIL